jgi:MFS family permease
MAAEAALRTGDHDHGFNADATGFATLMMGVGVGSLFGSIFVGGVMGGLARGRLYLIAGLLSGLGQVLLSFAPNMAIAFLAAAIMGGSQSAFMTMGQAMTQAIAADEFRGRLASINTFSLGGIMSFMNLANGYLGTHYPASAILLVNGLLFAGIVVASFGLAVPRGVYLRGMPVSRTPAAA